MTKLKDKLKEQGVIGKDGKPYNPKTSYAVCKGLPKPGEVVLEDRVCHTHSTWFLAVRCEKDKAPWYTEHTLVAIQRHDVGEFKVIGIITEGGFDGANLKGKYLTEKGAY